MDVKVKVDESHWNLGSCDQGEGLKGSWPEVELKAGDEEAEVARVAKWHLAMQPENQVFTRSREGPRSRAAFLEPTAGVAILLDFSVVKKRVSPFESGFSVSCRQTHPHWFPIYQNVNSKKAGIPPSCSFLDT